VQSFDYYIAATTRRLPLTHQLRGLRVPINIVQRFYGHRYAQRDERWAIINDFDSDLRMKLDRASLLGSVIYWFGNYSPNELHLLDRLLSPEMVFADIGANQGEFTLFAAKRLTRGQVLAFEPQETIFALLSENIALNGFENTSLHNIALADASGVVDLYMPSEPDHPGRPAFVDLPNEGVAMIMPEGGRGLKVGSARIETFDTVFAATDLARLDVIKIDVEGAELAVLRGARRTIEDHKPHIFMELNRETTGASGYAITDLHTFLLDLGYMIYRIKSAWQNDLGKNSGYLSLLRQEDVAAIAEQCDVLCAHPDHPLPISIMSIASR